MTKKLLTVVIPAYNAESYIQQCLRSVLNQTRTNDAINVIIVIDGATDRTLKIAERTINEYSAASVKLIIQRNLGLSGARNSGLDLVETEYVTFLDSDDYWLSEYHHKTLPVLLSLRPDIVEYDALLTNEHGNPTSTLKISSGPPHTTSHIDRNTFLKIFRCYAWARIYRTALIREKPFPLGKRFEDTLTIPWIYWQSHRIISLGIPLVGYRQHDGSILKTPILNDVLDLSIAARDAFQEYASSKDNYWQAVATRIFQQACARVIVLPFKLWRSAIQIIRANMPHPSLTSEDAIRKLQQNHAAIYIMLLYIKRNTLDKIKQHVRIRRFLSNQKRGKLG